MQILELSSESFKNNKSRVFLTESNQFSNSFCMLQYVLENFFCINIGCDSLYYGKYGKPYLKDRGIYFNVSHSGRYTVVALSSKEVGVDIQLVKKNIHWSNLFSRDECNLIKENYSDYNLGFSILWSCKEAYLKKLGRGLSVDYSTVLFDSLNLPIKYNNNVINWIILERDSEQYTLSLCLGS